MHPTEDPAAPGPRRWSVAVVGAGTAGLTVARELRRAARFDVTVYEARPEAGGNCRTLTVAGVRIDPAVQVLRSPRDQAALDLTHQVGVRLARVDATTSWVDQAGGTWRASPRRPSAADLARLLPFLRGARQLRAALDSISADNTEPLGVALARRDAAGPFTRQFFYPLCHAFWPYQRELIEGLPAGLVARHAREHAILRPWSGGWHRFEDGVMDFVAKLSVGVAVQVGTRVSSVRRLGAGVEVVTDRGPARYDLLVLATPPEVARALLQDASDEEVAALADFDSVPTRIQVHHDTRIMPAKRRDWATFNHRVHQDGRWSTTVWHNRLRGVGGPDVFATLSPPEDLRDVAETLEFNHLRWTPRTNAAQAAIVGLQGRRRTWWCGAWLGLGFQEDAVRSAIATASALGVNQRTGVAT